MCGLRSWKTGVEREKEVTTALILAVLLFAQVNDKDVTLDGCEVVASKDGMIWIACPEPSEDVSEQCKLLTGEVWTCRA